MSSTATHLSSTTMGIQVSIPVQAGAYGRNLSTLLLRTTSYTQALISKSRLRALPTLQPAATPEFSTTPPYAHIKNKPDTFQPRTLSYRTHLILQVTQTIGLPVRLKQTSRHRASSTCCLRSRSRRHKRMPRTTMPQQRLILLLFHQRHWCRPTTTSRQSGCLLIHFMALEGTSSPVPIYSDRLVSRFHPYVPSRPAHAYLERLQHTPTTAALYLLIYLFFDSSITKDYSQ
jgi:hypothetical protein